MSAPTGPAPDPVPDPNSVPGPPPGVRIRALLCRFFFAAVGAVATVFVALLMEGAYSLARYPGEGAPPLPFSHLGPAGAGASSSDQEVARRLREAGASGGDVQVTLSWENTNDLDLHVIDPTGFEIYFGRRRSPSGGMLDVDMNVAPVLRTRAIENVFFPMRRAPLGQYLVSVKNYRRNEETDPTPYRVEVRVRGHSRVYTGTLPEREMVTVTSFVLAEDKLQFAGEAQAISTRPGWSPHFDSSILKAFAVSILLLSLLTLALWQAFRFAAYLWRRDFPLKPSRTSPFEVLLPGLLGEAVLLTFGGVFGFTSMVYFLAWALAGGMLGRVSARLFPLLPPRAAVLMGSVVGAIAFTLATTPAAPADHRVYASAALGAGLGFLIIIPSRRPRKRVLRPPSRASVAPLRVRPLRRTGVAGSLSD